MTKRIRSFITFILTLCLLLSAMPSAATAATDPATAESTIVETPMVTEDPSPVQEEPPVLQLDADCQILRHVDAEVFAAGNHIARLPDEETLTSYIFLNADGSKTAYFMDQPVKFEAADGSIKEKDLTLTTATEGYTTAQNDIQLTLPTNPASGIRLAYSNRVITLIPQGGTLSSPAQATDSSVTYPGYYGDGISLRYTPTLSGVKEDILLDSYTGTNSFTFRLNTGGLNLYQANGRYFLAESKTSTDRVLLGDVVAYDARGLFSIGTLTSQTIMPGQAYLLTLTVDEAFLTSESTTYPVTIDPTIQISDNTTAGSIEDATVYEGIPTLNTGTWIYNHVGYYDSSYGRGHVVVRLKGLLESNEYINTSAENITSATFCVKEAGNSATGTVYLYPMYSNTTWTETGITWSNLGTYIGIAYDTVSIGSGQWASFDITEMLQDWKNGKRNPNAGFILDASYSNTAVKALYSSEHGTTVSRPYVVMTYNSDISLNKTIADVDQGSTLTLTASTTPAGQSVTWSSSNTSVATVNSSGRVTGVQLGSATITAKKADGTSASCLVYVTVADGVYYIQSANAGMYLTTNGSIADNTATSLQLKATSGLAQVRQLWKIKYLGNGYYVIRAMHKLNMGLSATSNNVNISSIKPVGASANVDYSSVINDTLDGVALISRWTITVGSSGYYNLHHTGTSSMSMTYPSGAIYTGMSVITAVYSSSSVSFAWELILVPGLFPFDSSYEPPDNSIPFEIEMGETYTPSEMGITIIASDVSGITWESSNTSILSVHMDSGETAAHKRGDATITVSAYGSQTEHSIQISVAVVETVLVKCYYDSTISGSSSIINSISTAVAFVDKSYRDQFNLRFTMDGAPMLYGNAAIDICNFHSNAPCSQHTGSNCSTNCSGHHKNVHRIAEELYPSRKNTVVVMWSNCKEGIFCATNNNGTHEEDYSSLALVPYEDTETDRILPPVVQFLTINEHQSITGRAYDSVFMSITLAHEIAHTLGMSDVYNNYYYPNATGHTDYIVTPCIMSHFTQDAANDFYEAIMAGTSAFCPYCIDLLHSELQENVYDN